MANAKRDQNNVPTAIGTLNTNGSSIVLIAVNPTNHSLKVSNGTTGTASTRTNAPRDENDVPAWMGVKSTDMTTPIPIAVDSSGNVLIKST